ncbi:methyltransferase family protein [Streptomyces lavendulae]
MDSLHCATVFVTHACVALFCLAWVSGVLYFAATGPGGPMGWVRGLHRSVLRKIFLVAAVYTLLAIVDATHGLWRRIGFWQPELALTGTVVVLASTALLLWARWVLGSMWASVPTVHSQHELRTDGPYRLVRHPIYTGLLGLVGGGMFACGFGVWTAYLIAVLPWLLLRVRREDALMSAQFGAQYEAYRARVPALIPVRASRSGRP